LTAAGAKEHGELLLNDLSSQREASEHSAFVAWCEMENAVFQAIGCLDLLQDALGRKLIEDAAKDKATGIYHLSEATSKRLHDAFCSISRIPTRRW
jgi:hypothetical protein